MSIWELTQNFIPNNILHCKEIRTPSIVFTDNNNNLKSVMTDVGNSLIINHGLGGSIIFSPTSIELYTVPTNGDINLNTGTGKVYINGVPISSVIETLQAEIISLQTQINNLSNN